VLKWSMVQFFYTYVLKSLEDGKFYIGYTKNLKARFDKHLKGEAKATRNRRPLVLVYFEACLSKKKALEREKYFKTGFGRRFLKMRI